MANTSTKTFDKAYYARYYQTHDTRAVSPEEQTVQAEFIAAYVRYLGIDVATIVDIGCGIGTMLHATHARFPNAASRGIEYSPYLCEHYGWHKGNIVELALEPHDLVICNDVLGYLDDADCEVAINNLAHCTAGALYLSVLTSDDLDVCDQAHTDMSQTLRPAAWYRSRIEPHFVAVGGGLFLPQPVSVPVWALERT